MIERDISKPAEQQGLFRKFEVRRVDGSDAPGGKHEGCRYFVLDMDHDIHSKPALLAYADSCVATHPELANDLRKEFDEKQSLDKTELDSLKMFYEVSTLEEIVTAQSEHIARLQSELHKYNHLRFPPATQRVREG